MKAKKLPQEGIVFDVSENLQEVIWTKIISGVKKFIIGLMENLLNEELTAKVGGGRYERDSTRQGYRNGYYLRHLLPRFGLIEAILVS